ncbi:MAG: winged helix-turn-helix transcriptional regulator [Candidatus Aenigmarchaeota archaeon]|nr:winged helix-turn-helix transcriptional regulator [Candidatus Aenigmarchaeota archaeon]
MLHGTTGTAERASIDVREEDVTHRRFPDDHEERLGAILDMANRERKSVTLLLLDENWRISPDIRDSWVDKIPGSEPPDCTLIRNFSHFSLTPNGLAMEGLWYHEGWMQRAWRITEEGKKFGWPAAAFSLQYAKQKGASLYSILGQTRSCGDEKSTYRRIKILEELYAGDSTIVELSGKLGIPRSVVRRHLRRLEQTGLVSVESAADDNRRNVYERNPENAGSFRPVSSLPRLTERVYVYFVHGGKGSCHEVARAIGYSHVGRVSVVLSGLERQKVLFSHWKGKEKSRVEIAGEGRCFLSEYVNVLRNAMEEGAELSRLSDLHHEMRRSGTLWEHASHGLRLYDAPASVY